MMMLIFLGMSVPGEAGEPPGAEPYPEDLVQRIEKAVKAKGPEYKPRTRHLAEDGHALYTNRLILTSSPYLLQHAHNPVNWYPWGDEAFETARRLNRPVLLSVGYSTCHWCHVMEEESFEDPEIARYMNENYIAIKVDRETRPDVDSIYMSAVQAMTGSGGWPMTVWLTPDRRPYYGATYIPPRDGDRGARFGFLTMLQRLKQAFDEEPDKVTGSAAEITNAVQARLTAATGTAAIGPDIIEKAVDYYKESFDATNGGVRGQRKFPSSLPVRMLLRYHRRTRDAKALEMATMTLRKMAAGGLHDQVGGGFHRYTTDPEWLVPHFEKMLYDNALLVSAYLEGYQATGDEEFARVARDTLRYVERDMTSPEGAFYSATDADSLAPGGHREEGYFFTWTPSELAGALGEEKARIVSKVWGVTESGDFEGRNILHLPGGSVPADLRPAIDEAREILYRKRAGRPAPLRDEKILTAWNGLMISAHAQAALVLDEEGYARAAERAAGFLLDNLKRRDGRLLRSYKDGQAGHPGYLQDYAFLIAGLLDLYEVTGEGRWLEEAIALDRTLEKHHEDAESGGFFLTSDDHEELLAREKPDHDGAVPSGNSVAALNLLRLHELTTEDRYRQRAEKTMKASDLLGRAPMAVSEMLLAVDFHVDTPKEIVIVTSAGRTQAGPFLDRLREVFLPNRVVTVATEGEHLDSLSEMVPLLKEKVARDGDATAYVCERGVCDLPTTDPEVFEKQIREVAAGKP